MRRFLFAALEQVGRGWKNIKETDSSLLRVARATRQRAVLGCATTSGVALGQAQRV